MFKPTKKQHVVNKAYADKNGGSGGGALFIRIDYIDEEASTIVYDKTWKQVRDAMYSGMPCYVVEDQSDVGYELVSMYQTVSYNDNPDGPVIYYLKADPYEGVPTTSIEQLLAVSADGYLYVED